LTVSATTGEDAFAVSPDPDHPEGFYDAIAGDYDAVIDAESRSAAINAFADRLTTEGGDMAAVDVACGTGAYALTLAGRGARVVGADISEAMLERARANGERQGLAVRWVRSAMQELALHVDGPFDVVLCMGNSLPHLLTDTDLRTTLAGFRQIVAASGRVLVHLLNYERICAARERIVGVVRRGDVEHVRFYDFLEDHLRFNVLTLRWQDGQASHDLQSTDLRPFTAAELTSAFAEAGFGRVETYGGLEFTPFDRAESQTLLIDARP